ncbi:hypothetical protein WMR86_19855 (plasmid) [Proteus vulgaris]|nr:MULTISPECIES: hypothetical protein [Morganellaceae]EJD6501278.1 hypothetical protein [Providencia rettgeri]EKT9734975.1 hypothetical protein [Proteus mirabilis]EKW6744351.1 hypothetical protein [Proteus mirabilis]EKX9075222.1 hypothetical protein [Proteus mirabilis]ELR5170614.1 hypothetical protein [Providencia rettgeri]
MNNKINCYNTEMTDVLFSLLSNSERVDNNPFVIVNSDKTCFVEDFSIMRDFFSGLKVPAYILSYKEDSQSLYTKKDPNFKKSLLDVSFLRLTMLIESAIINSMSGTDTNHFFWFNDCQSYNTINKFSFKEILFSLYSKQINISPIYRPSIISTRLVDSDGYHKKYDDVLFYLKFRARLCGKVFK